MFHKHESKATSKLPGCRASFGPVSLNSNQIHFCVNQIQPTTNYQLSRSQKPSHTSQAVPPCCTLICHDDVLSDVIARCVNKNSLIVCADQFLSKPTTVSAHLQPMLSSKDLLGHSSYRCSGLVQPMAHCCSIYHLVGVVRDGSANP